MKLYNIYCKYCNNMISDRGFRVRDEYGDVTCTSEYVFLSRLSDIGNIFYANACNCLSKEMACSMCGNELGNGIILKCNSESCLYDYNLYTFIVDCICLEIFEFKELIINR